MYTAAIDYVSLGIPRSELPFVRSLARKFGWEYKKHRKSGLQQALDDVREGRVYEAENVEDLMKQLNA